MVVDITPLDSYMQSYQNIPAIEYKISAPQNTPPDKVLYINDTFGGDFEKANPQLEPWDKGIIHNDE